MEQDDIIKCSNCGQEIFVCDSFAHTDGRICESCYDDLYDICSDCGGEFLRDALIESSERNPKLYCGTCYTHTFTSCHSCDKEIRRDSAYEVFGDSYCENCYSDRFTTCENCGCEMDRDDVHYDSRDRACCDDCYRDEESRYIHEHHEWEGRLSFYPEATRDEKPDALYLGVELETEYRDMGDVADELYELSNYESLFHLENDGSLNNGIEIITMPMTLDYHVNDFRWDRITKTVMAHKGKSHDTSTCGLHIHFNSKYFGDMYDEDVLKLLFIFERFWHKFVKFSRRTEESLDRWARRYCDISIDNNTRNQMRREINTVKCAGRYLAVNIENDNTIEIRIFKGTLKVSTIMASIQLVDFLARYVHSASILDVQSLTWNRLVAEISSVKYPQLVEYLISKELAVAVQLPMPSDGVATIQTNPDLCSDADSRTERGELLCV
jgi:hypothetical protein